MLTADTLFPSPTCGLVTATMRKRRGSCSDFGADDSVVLRGPRVAAIEWQQWGPRG